MINMTSKEYDELKIAEAILQQLEINGVDNWQGYGCMCHELGEDECIFCTEDKEKYLGLNDE